MKNFSCNEHLSQRTISIADLILLVTTGTYCTHFISVHFNYVPNGYILYKQECIPVGCVPAARRPYSGVCFPGGVCLVRGGVCLVLGVSAWSRGVCLVGGVMSAWSGWVSAWFWGGSGPRGGVPGPGGSSPRGGGQWYPSMH